MRKLLAGATLAVVVVLGGQGVAFAKEPSEISKCVVEKVEAKQPQLAEDCVESPNPILPATNELAWGSAAFVVLFFALWKFAFPGLKKGLEGRAERIRKSLDEAEQAKDEAQSILDEYQRQLADAKSESARIIEEARQAADNLRRDLQQRAEAEVNELKQRAQDDIRAQVDRAMADLRTRVAELSIDLAEKVVERNLDRETNLALIESYITQVGAAGS